jgi:thioredoxin-related protein
MKKTTSILLLVSLSLLSAKDNISEPFTRSDTLDARDKAIQARDKLEASIAKRAEDIYKTRLRDEEKPSEDINSSVEKEIVKVKVKQPSNIVSIDDVLNGK